MSDDRAVLIVDDSATMRQLLKLAVKRAGISRVFEANNGEEALQLLAKETVSLLLTDVNMPLMGGLALIDKVRANPLTATIPIVVITTEGEEENRIKTLAIGAADYVTKPIQSVAVVAVVKRILGL